VDQVILDKYYNIANERYEELGVDIDKALQI